MKSSRSMLVYVAAVSNLNHVAVLPEVQTALLSWIKAQGSKPSGVLIGGLALSFYSRPRATTDVDLLFLNNDDIPDQVEGFKRTRKGAFEEKKHHVEIEVTTSHSFRNLPQGIVQKVFDTAVVHDGIRVASREGLIALKLISAETHRRRLQDLADVVSLVSDVVVDMKNWPLSNSQKSDLQSCIEMTK